MHLFSHYIYQYLNHLLSFPLQANHGFWNCPCVPMRERKECHCMLFLTEDNDFVGTEQTITVDEVPKRLIPFLVPVFAPSFVVPVSVLLCQGMQSFGMTS